MKKKIIFFIAAMTAAFSLSGCSGTDGSVIEDSTGKLVPVKPENYDYTVLVDDEVCTISGGGTFDVGVLGREDEVPVYIMTITNNTDKAFLPKGGFEDTETGETLYGLIGEEIIHTLTFADSHYLRPYLINTFTRLGPEETLYFYICPFLDIKNYLTKEQLVDVLVYFSITDPQSKEVIKRYELDLG